MLSMHNIASASGGAKYYLETADYYQGNEEYDKPEFQGKHMTYLVGASEFTVEKFTKLLNGELPDGGRLGKIVKGEVSHRPGVDLTFSAPKSLSILALVDGRTELVDAHKRAVEETLSYIEKNLSFTRNNGKLEKADNISATKFLQTLSRENDPQLHTHCVLLNMILRTDGKWRSMCTEGLYENKMMLGQYYRSTLGKILVGMGYELDVNKGDGTFEIRGVSKQLNQQFSKRREQIEAISEETGITSAAGLQAISTNSRKKAPVVSKEALLARWNGEVEMLKADLSQIKPDPERQITQGNKTKIARDAVVAAIKKLDTSQRFYSKEEVVLHAMRQSFDKYGCPIEIEKAVNRCSKKNILMSIGKDNGYHISGVTYEAEVRLREAASKPWDRRHLHVGDRVKNFILKHSMKDMAKINVLAKEINSNRQISLVDNFIVSQDSKALLQMIKTAKAYGKPVSVVAMSSVERENLYSNRIYSIGIDKYMNEKAIKNGVVIVCGAEKATIQKIDMLLSSTNMTNSKLVLLNANNNGLADYRYSPIELLALSGVERVAMRENDGAIVKRSNILGSTDRLVEVSSFAAIAECYGKSGVGLIISNDHARLNLYIREALIKQGVLGEQSVTLSTYASHYMTDLEMGRSVNYRINDLLKIENMDIISGVNAKEIKSGDHFKVINIDGNQLQIEHGRKKIAFTLDLDNTQVSFQDFSVYRHSKMEVREGDVLMLPRQDIYGEKYVNSRGTVKQIIGGAILLDIGMSSDFKLNTQDRDVFIERGFAIGANRPINGWKGGIDLHLEAESMANVLKNLSDEKIDKIQAIYTKDVESVKEELGRMGATIDFVSGRSRNMVVENEKNEKIREITIEVKQTREDRGRLSYNATEIAIKKITEKEFDFTSQDVFREAGAISVGGLSVEEVMKAIDKKIAAGELVKLDTDDNKERFSTKELLYKKEMALDATVSPVNPISDKSSKLILALNIPEEHMKAVNGLLLSKKVVSLVQGFAGTAKTSLTLKHFAEIAKKNGRDVHGYAPTHSACSELRTKANIKANTVERLMQGIHKGNININSKSIIIVDESSMLSLNDISTLINTCVARRAKLVLVGDQNQQPSVGAGEMFRHLVNSDTADIYKIQEVRRQKTGEYRHAVQHLANGHVSEFFTAMKDRIIEVKGKDREPVTVAAVHFATASEYASISKHTRDTAQIITLTNDSRNQINNDVRKILIEKGDLSNDRVSVRTYQSLDHSSATRHFASTLVEGSVIRFNSPDGRLGIQAGEYLTIVNVSDKDNTLTLARDNGDKLPVRPERSSLMCRGGLEVYKQEERNPAVGEKIIFRRSIEESGVLNTDMGVITSFHGTLATVQLKDKIIELDLSKQQNRHWDYGYAITSHVFQGKDCQTLLLHFDTRSKPLANYQSFYVGVTRGEYDMKVFTDNAAAAKDIVMETYLEKNNAPLAIVQKVPTEDLPDHNIASNVPLPKPLLLDQHERAQFSHSAEMITRAVMGEPLKIRGTTFYYGKKGGSLRVETAGEKAGLWNDFAQGCGGDILGLIKYQTGRNFAESVEIARSIVGDGRSTLDYALMPSKIDSSSKTPDNTEKIERARAIFNSGITIDGTVGEKYLVEHRKIPADVLAQANKEIRFVPEFQFDNKPGRKFNALAFAARNAMGEVQAVQVVLLNPQTGKKIEGQAKYSFGAMTGASLMLGKEGAEVYIAEGPETALSVFAAKPNADVRAVFSVSNIRNTSIPLSAGSVVICADNDGVGSAAEKTVAKAVETLKDKVPRVRIVMPSETGQDFNDLIQRGGVEAVSCKLESSRQILRAPKQLERQI